MHIFTCIIEKVICCRSYITEGHISHGSYITDARISLRSYITEGIFVQELNLEGGYIYIRSYLAKKAMGATSCIIEPTCLINYIVTLQSYICLRCYLSH